MAEEDGVAAPDGQAGQEELVADHVDVPILKRCAS
jgi:hypothetical protein